MSEFLLDLFWKIGRSIVPPSTATNGELYWYRIRVALVACTAFVGLLLFGALAFGVTPWFDGFARASDMQAVNAEIREYRASDTDGQILELRLHHCAAPKEAKTIYWERISDLIGRWQKLTGAPTYPLPSCEQLGVGP